MISLVDGLDKINRIACQPVEGSLYVFPSVSLPPQSMKVAEASGLSPDLFYCISPVNFQMTKMLPRRSTAFPNITMNVANSTHAIFL